MCIRDRYDGTAITTLSDKELTLFRKENVGFIFQQYYLLPNMSVDKNVKMGADLGPVSYTHLDMYRR